MEIDIKISYLNVSWVVCIGSVNKMVNVYIWRVGWILKIFCFFWLFDICMGYWKSVGLIIL